MEGAPPLTMKALTEPHDVLRDGWVSMRQDTMAMHPVQAAAVQRLRQEKAIKTKLQVDTLGSAFPMRLAMEKMTLKQFQRLPTLPSSNVGLDTVMGRDETIGFEDVFDNKYENEENTIDLHNAMEKRLGMKMPRLQ